MKQVSKIEEAEHNLFKLHTSDPEAVRKQILELALQQQLNILSLQSESRSLEDVFRSLTHN